jgi:hypothetical protein
MRLKISIIMIAVLSMASCSNDQENCQCNQYLKSSNGTLTEYGSASMGFCDGTMANPNPSITVYKKECN